MAWNVPTATSRADEPISFSSRSFISAAALLVNVTARIFHGKTPFSLTSQAIRWVITLVFPLPGPAKTSSGPSVVVTASRWGWFSPESKSVCPSSPGVGEVIRHLSSNGNGHTKDHPYNRSIVPHKRLAGDEY